jgi:hypothetical protein
MTVRTALRILAVASVGLLGACALPDDGSVGSRAGDSGARPANAAPTESAPTDSAPTTPPPSVEKRTVTEQVTIPFPRTTVKDSSLAKGTTRVRKAGVAGVKTLTYELTFTNGVQTGKTLVKEEVTTPPVAEVTAVGTKVVATQPASRCDPNYSGACVPIASDVDCAGGSGNGPAYVRGPVRVIGVDIYDLDRDGDGIGCD